MIEFLSYQAIASGIILLITMTGWLISGFIRENQERKEEQLLFHLLLGMLFLITGFALFMSGGITILAGLFIPLFFLRKRLSFFPNFSLNKLNFNYFKWIGLIFILSCIYSFIEFLWIYNWEVGQIIEVPHLDFLYYAKYSYSFAMYGEENRLLTLNKFFPEYQQIRMPYHYPEIWFNALIVKIAGKSALKSLLLVSYPIQKAILTFLILVGVRMMKIEISVGKSLLIAVLLMSITGFYFSFYNNSELLKYFDGITQTGSLMNLAKKYLLMSIYVSYFLFFYFNKGHYKTFFISLSIIPLFSIGAAPGVLGLLILMPIYLYFTKRISANNVVAIYLNSISIFLFIAGFYTVFGGSELNASLSKSFIAIELLQNPDFAKLKSLLFGFLFPFLRFVLFYSPYFLITFLVFKKKTPRLLSDIIIVILILSFGGCLAASMALGIHDNGQFFYNILPIINSALALCFVHLWISHSLTKYLKTALTIAMVLFGTYHQLVDINKTLNAKQQTNYIHPLIRVANLNKVKFINSDSEIIGLFREKNTSNHDYSYLYSTCLNQHTYLYFLDNFGDAINIDIEPYLSNCSNSNSVDQYLLLQNEFNVFMKKEKLSYTPEALNKFAKFTHASFLADGDSLIILKNSEIPENLPFYLTQSPGD